MADGQGSVSALAGPREDHTAVSPPRDPRRLSRQNSLATIPRPVVTTLPTNVATVTPSEDKMSYGDKLVENLAGLSTHIAAAANLESEQSKARKTLDAINHHHDKLKNLDQFPAARDLACFVRDSRNGELEDLRNELNTQKEGQKKLVRQAVGLFNSPESRGQSQSLGHLKSIEAEAKSTKLSIERITEDIAALKKENAMQIKENSILQRQIREQANELQLIRRNRHEDVDYLKKVHDRGIDRAFAQIRELKEEFGKSTDHVISPVDLKRIEQLEADFSKMLSSLAETVNAAVARRLREVETASSSTPEIEGGPVKALSQRLNAVEATLSQMSNNASQQPIKLEAKSPDSRYEHLQKVLQDIIEVQAFKDDQQMKAIEDTDNKLEQRLQETVSKIKADVKSQIDLAMQQAKDDQVLTRLDKMANLKETSEINDQRLQTVEMAIVSLESRYNSINPNALVDQAMPIFQRMYPAPHTLHAALGDLNTMQIQLSRLPDFARLSTAAENNAKQLSTIDSTVARCTEEARNATIEMRNHKQQVQQDLADLQKGFAGLKELNELRNNFALFIRDYQINHDGIQMSLQNIIQEKDRVAGEVSALRDHVNLQIQVQSRELKIAMDKFKNSQIQISEPREMASVMDHVNKIQGQYQELKTAMDKYKESQIQNSEPGEIAAMMDQVNKMQVQYQELKIAMDQFKESQIQHSETVANTDQLKGLQAEIQELDRRLSFILDSFKPEDMRLRLLNIEVSLKEQNQNTAHQLERIQDEQRTANEDVSSLEQYLEQFQQELDNIKEQLVKNFEDSGSRESNVSNQELAQNVAKLAKRVRHLENAKTAIETQLNNGQALNAEPQQARFLQSNIDHPMSAKAKKRKRNQSNPNSPLDP